MAPEEPDAVWVISDVMPDGTYAATIHAGGDVAITLDRARAIAHAGTALAAVVRAEYDAAVWRQMLDVIGKGLAEADAQKLTAEVIAGLRDDRPPLDDSATAPFRFEPFVAYRTYEPGVFLWLNGKKISQWTVADARSHAMYVLEVTLAVDLDAAYRRHLIAAVGLEDWRARAVVGDLAKYRPEG